MKKELTFLVDSLEISTFLRVCSPAVIIGRLWREECYPLRTSCLFSQSRRTPSCLNLHVISSCGSETDRRIETEREGVDVCMCVCEGLVCSCESEGSVLTVRLNLVKLLEPGTT